MRQTQNMGLCTEARYFLSQHALKLNPCDYCGRDDGYVFTVLDETHGMFQEENFYAYKLEDGRTAREFLQDYFWSSGPVEFLGLRLSDGSEILWPKSEMEQYS